MSKMHVWAHRMSHYGPLKKARCGPLKNAARQVKNDVASAVVEAPPEPSPGQNPYLLFVTDDQLVEIMNCLGKAVLLQTSSAAKTEPQRVGALSAQVREFEFKLEELRRSAEYRQFKSKHNKTNIRLQFDVRAFEGTVSGKNTALAAIVSAWTNRIRHRRRTVTEAVTVAPLPSSPVPLLTRTLCLQFDSSPVICGAMWGTAATAATAAAAATAATAVNPRKRNSATTEKLPGSAKSRRRARRRNPAPVAQMTEQRVKSQEELQTLEERKKSKQEKTQDGRPGNVQWAKQRQRRLPSTSTETVRSYNHSSDRRQRSHNANQHRRRMSRSNKRQTSNKEQGRKRRNKNTQKRWQRRQRDHRHWSYQQRRHNRNRHRSKRGRSNKDQRGT
jgi:hypothetical protein